MSQYLRRMMLPSHPDIVTRKILVPTPYLSPIPLPSPREAHFWYMVPDEVNDESLLDQYSELLSSCERDNVFGMKDKRLWKGALLARALLRTTLSRYTRCEIISPRSLKFKKNKYGKPEVDWQCDGQWVPPSLHFNISHTSSLIACGVTLDVPIGIDLEEKQRRLKSDILSFARRYFSTFEVEFLQAIADPENQRQEFVKLWTLKEAYVKALGRGFSAAPFSRFTIQFRVSEYMKILIESQIFLAEHPFLIVQLLNVYIKSLCQDDEITVEDSENSKNLTSNWQFALFELDGSHYASVCMEKNKISDGRGREPMRLKVWKTLPFVNDEFVSGTDAVISLNGLS
ncbi:L-aminoadipate-semialdehyde dehydrogenase-phosphopantetheinyl transferase-like isoform X5 [Dioscorea cayenensis subsp. rotundata]|nr:L-aminoadipate-semialdehyde dehydrogenase-phosphopantetheinyl transferase-like isoform X5 [Dioscorea cayenensis subsp. rotundata]XP_039141722.1 L-aminoadipate-semialdehyde dehydrogenase-phosphopantetheinyl transferase-like isoform X5 [Dioscorea cayenensis subsp. rotundata]